MIEKITLDMLTQDSVSLKKQKFTIADGKEYAVGGPWRRAYENSASGRTSVISEVADPYKTAIFTVWGNAPTVKEIIA